MMTNPFNVSAVDDRYTPPVGVPSLTIPDKVTRFLRKETGRFTAGEVAEAIGERTSSVSSALSALYADAVEHRGAGVYGFGPTYSRSYQWCSSYPGDEALSPIKKQRPGRRASKRSLPSGAMVLTPHEHFDDIWVSGDKAYRVRPVSIRTEYTIVED